MEKKKAIIYFDGACLPFNPGGVTTYGFVIKDENDNVIFCGKGVATEQGTNNIAEYTGLIEGLKKAKELGFNAVKIYGDSMLVVNQINGFYSVKSHNIYPLYSQAVKLLKEFSFWKFQWVRRTKNKHADRLSTEAFVEYIENKNKQRMEKLIGKQIISENGFYKIKDYIVTLNPLSCTCQYFQRYNSFPLLQKDKIKVKCKHILYIEKMLKENNNGKEKEKEI